jgi:hypothetical protein
VAVVGVTAFAQGERLIDNAIARLVDIESYSEPSPVSLLDAVIAPERAGPLVRTEGKVLEAGPARFLLAAESGLRAEVALTGRKDPGVESPETPIPAPEVGRYVQVTGIVTVSQSPDGGTWIHIRPRSASEVIGQATPLAERLWTLAKWAMMLCLALAAGFVFRRNGGVFKRG